LGNIGSHGTETKTDLDTVLTHIMTESIEMEERYSTGNLI